ncbi:MAG: hypothetical protein R3212_05735 [Xanthomonadales bacterium]|nr:hypothetical protein [Xanthomonadales bacterium]
MSWHTSAIVIQGDHGGRGPALLAEIGFPGKSEVGEVNGDEAGSGDLAGRAMAVVSGWTIIWDPMMFVPEDLSSLDGMMQDGIWAPAVERALARLSQNSKVYSFLAEGASDTNGFAWYVHGERKRVWLSQAGQVVLNAGAILSDESEAQKEEPYDEQRLFVLMEKLTGLAMNTVVAATYKRFA